MRRILLRLVVALLVVIAAFALTMALYNQHRLEDLSGELMVAANELQHGDPDAPDRYYGLQQQLQAAANGQDSLLLALGISLACCLGFILYIYLAILRPFHKLERFARHIAAGDYDRPLDMPRHNVFGAFSWAFDSMREGLDDARQAEHQARQANKLLIASISHDIKTPIASIRACAEALGSGQASSPERQSRYLDTIIRKSDEVAQLTDDLFLHALADIDQLVIEPKPLALPTFIASIAADNSLQAVLGKCRLNHPHPTKLTRYAPSSFAGAPDSAPSSGQSGTEAFIGASLKVEKVPDVRVIADEKRLGEIFANILDNAGKYAAGEPLRLSFGQDGGQLCCVFEDQGTTLAADDLPFIFDKFYRGCNAADQQGSGLGLYIVRYLAQRMGGDAHAELSLDGLRIIVRLPIAP